MERQDREQTLAIVRKRTFEIVIASAAKQSSDDA